MSAIGSVVARRPTEALATESMKEAAKPAASAAPTEQPSQFARMLHGMGNEIAGGEQMIHAALHSGGSDLGPTDLLALQAGIYRYTETLDLASKLVDHATSGLKTVIQGSGQ